MFKNLVIGISLLLMVSCASGTTSIVPTEAPTASPIVYLNPAGAPIPECGSRICLEDLGFCLNIVSEATGMIGKYPVYLQFVDVTDNFIPDVAFLFAKNPDDGFWYLLTDEPLEVDVALEIIEAHDLIFRTCRNA